MKSKKIINVVGARPNFMKIAPLFHAYKNTPEINPILLHTGQHYDAQMSQLFFEELELPRPDIYLGIGTGNQAEQTAHIMLKFDKVCKEEKPDFILVVGDVTSTVACALVAVKRNIPIIHLEAGLRSFDRSMPEEINRILTDSISSYLITPSIDANENLEREGVPHEKIFLLGNIMIDTLCLFQEKVDKSDIIKKLNLNSKKYLLATLHRPGNVDTKENLEKCLRTLNNIASSIPVVFPIHPRTQKNIQKFEIESLITNKENFRLIEPQGYLDFQKLVKESKAVITDSGGIQEETSFLKIPCFTLRPNTERPVTITQGTNTLVKSFEELPSLLKNQNTEASTSVEIPCWDGKTAERLVSLLKEL